ncbi:MAG: hypothetical protein P8X39_02105, partial [Desulfofustis sp.]
MIRREFITYSAAALAGSVLGRFGPYLESAAADSANNPFASRLFIPPLLERDPAIEDRASFSLNVQKS